MMNRIEQSIIQHSRANEDWPIGDRDEAKIRCLKLLLEEVKKRGWKNIKTVEIE